MLITFAPLLPITLKFCFDALHKIEQAKPFGIAGCFNCEQVLFLRRTQAKQDVARNSRNFWKTMAAMHNPHNDVLRLN